jgi:hypothetical protein
MLVTEAEGQLKGMLKAEGFDISKPNPQIAWNVFKSFVQKPVECADDAVLFQCGTFSFTGKDLFYLDFVRQFSIDDEDGEYDHMEQLHCEFTCNPNKELNPLEKNLWSYDFKDLNDYFAAVENLSEFQTAINHQDWECLVEQEEV